jgi:hypothetical protein
MRAKRVQVEQNERFFGNFSKKIALKRHKIACKKLYFFVISNKKIGVTGKKCIFFGNN